MADEVTYTILGAIWFNPPAPGFSAMTHKLAGLRIPIIGIVAIESYAGSGHWKCYIGWAWGEDRELDAQHIAEYGLPLLNDIAARGFFPALDPEKYKI